MTDAYDPTLVVDYPFFSSVNAAGDFENRSGYGIDGTPFGLVGDDSELVDGHLGQSLDNPTVNSGINLGAGLDALIFPGLMTTEFWVTNAAVAGVNGGRFLDTGIIRLYWDSINSRVQMDGAVGSVWSPNGSFIGGQLYQVVLTQDGAGNSSVYINGAWTVTAAVTIAVATAGWILFNRATLGRGYDSAHHRARIWNRNMGAAEIYERYQYAAMR